MFIDLNGNNIDDRTELANWFKGLIVDFVDSNKDGELDIEEIIISLAKAGYAIVKATK